MFTTVLLIIAAFALLLIMIMLYWRRIVDGSLTAHFRAAEAISEGHIPEQWIRQINRRLRRPMWLAIFGRNKSGTDLALEKLDKLTQFFGRSRFFESDEAKIILLDQLAETQQRWAELHWEELQQQISVDKET